MPLEHLSKVTHKAWRISSIVDMRDIRKPREILSRRKAIQPGTDCWACPSSLVRRSLRSLSRRRSPLLSCIDPVSSEPRMMADTFASANMGKMTSDALRSSVSIQSEMTESIFPAFTSCMRMSSLRLMQIPKMSRFYRIRMGDCGLV